MTFINIILYFALGMLLSAIGFSFLTWQFWAVALLVWAVQLNSMFIASR